MIISDSNPNNNLGGCSFETREDGAYVKYILPGGADPVLKKLGSGLKLKVVMHYAGGSGYTPYGGCAVIFENESVSQLKMDSGSFAIYTIGGIYGSNNEAVLTQTHDLNIPTTNWTALSASGSIYDVSAYKYIMMMFRFDPAQYQEHGAYRGIRWTFTQD